MGPLAGITVVELAGLGPVPFCGMMLGDMGAKVIRVERASSASYTAAPKDPLLRNRQSIALNLKTPQGVKALLKLIETCDVLLEGFRPGVMERLGLGPELCLSRNPRLIFGRMTGWGQQGPLARAAGHDINYIALTGALHLIGPTGGKPTPPLNLVGDFGGGGMLLCVGVLAALLEVRHGGSGQVIDAAMIDGTTATLAMFFGFRTEGRFQDATGQNHFAGAAPYYGVYRTRDHKYVAVGALEPQFFAELMRRLEIDPAPYDGAQYPSFDSRTVNQLWPALHLELVKAFATRTRDELCILLEGTDACFSPVLTLEEAASHPHNIARDTHIEINGVIQNAPAPRFQRTPASVPVPPRRAGEDTDSVLLAHGFSNDEIETLRTVGALT
jgi:alpha-methylacyl-CoA racemase